MNERKLLERRLAEALDSAAGGVPVPGDAWQRHQRRLAADRAHQRVRRLRVAGVAAAAAAVTAVAAIGLPHLVGSASSTDAAAGGGSGPVGRRVVLERSTGDGVATTFTAYLTREGGKGLSLCSKLETSTETGTGNEASGSSSGSGGCTAPGPGSSRFLPHLFGGSDGTATSSGHVLTGAATARVSRVVEWSADGGSGELALHPLGVDGLQAFGVGVTGGGAPPQRLLAYGKGGALLEAVDLDEEFAGQWLPGANGCSGAPAPQRVAGSEASVALQPTAASIAVPASAAGAARTECLPLRSTLQGVRASDRDAVLVVAPEVAAVELRPGGPTQPAPPVADGARSTLWRAVSLRPGSRLTPSDTLVALDSAGRELATIPVSSLR